jgi:cation transport protein ChaC
LANIVTIESDAGKLDLRELLRGENFLAAARELPMGGTMRTQQELEDTLEHILRQHDAGSAIHVFGYGSLMWNPAFDHDGQFKARVYGWHRWFCLRNLVGRGTPEHPGLMLALDKGGSCNGMVLRIPGSRVRDELTLLWRREMSWGSYHARWVTCWVGTTPVRAVTFVVNRRHERYVKGMPMGEAARLILTGNGSLGTCRSYFDSTLQKLRQLGIRDHKMEQLNQAIRDA